MYGSISQENLYIDTGLNVFFLSSDHHQRVDPQLVFIPIAVSSLGGPQVDVTIKYYNIARKFA